MAKMVEPKHIYTGHPEKIPRKIAKAGALGLGTSGLAKAGTGAKTAKDLLTMLGILL